MEEGQRLSRQKSFAEARDRFHAARLRCADNMSLLMIAYTYQEQGDLPRALAYIEEFLAVAGEGHESRAAIEMAATQLRERVPAEQRVSIAAELSAERSSPVTSADDLRTRLDKQVENFDWEPSAIPSHRDERATGFFVGANFAYATMAKVEIATQTMNGRVDFPAVFAAELQAGYRFLPFLSVALAPQMLFNLRPYQQDPAHEFELFVETTGHLVVSPRWDLNLFAAPGYSVLIIPDAENASGPAFRWGGGPSFHLTEHISFAADLSHQIGFQTTARGSGDVDMATSFFTLLAGVRLRL